VSNIRELPVVVKPMKDAARAAKVSVRWAMHRIKEITVTYLLDLSQFIVSGYWLERRGEQEIVHLYGMHREEVAICPRCHQVSMTYMMVKNAVCVIWMFGANARFCTLPVVALIVSDAVGLSPKSWLA
jgi:hypothetical protein